MHPHFQVSLNGKPLEFSNPLTFTYSLTPKP